MASIPGANNVLPGVFTNVVTQSRGVAIPGGTRIAAILGEGAADETVVTQAVGGGVDGFNSTYTSTTGADGRHFQLASYPIVAGRTSLYKNGVLLTGLEASISSSAFSNRYDYRIDTTTGRIELQSGHLRDQGGTYYIPVSTNVGDGYIASLTLVDSNAPPETWTMRCISVQRDALNQPIEDTAKFIAFGSISGAKLDTNGNPIIWTANGVVVSNGILSMAIYETKSGGSSVTPFREGDGFTIIVDSGVLVANDTLTASYIPTENLNDPVFLDGMQAVIDKHGFPSTDNTLSLGAQLAFANQAAGIMACQTAPAMPRRTSYTLVENMDATSTQDDDFIFPFPAGIVPDPNSEIHFFVTNNTTNVETQVLPNKLDYYLLDTPGYPTTNSFIFDDTPAPAGYSYYYTVKTGYEALAFGEDGYIARGDNYYSGVFSSSVEFDSTYVGKSLKIVNAANVANEGSYTIDSVSGGNLYITRSDASPYFPDYENDTGVAFQVISISSGLALDGYSGTDGVLTKSVGTATATLDSATVDFSTIPNLETLYRIKIVGSDSEYNDGQSDITGSAPNQVSIRKGIIQESDMRYEALDLTDASYYVVVNHNVVPDTYQLRITVITTTDASFYDAGWLNALEAMETVECDILVPLPKQTISVIFQNALAHCKSMSNIRNKKERVLFCGAINGLTPDNLTGTSLAAVEDIGILEGIQGDNVTEVLAGNIEDLANYSVADAFGNTYRCVYFYPDQIVVQAGTDNVLIDGFYLAAAAAGYEAADIRIENPLTNKTLTGFTILRDKQFSQSVLERLAQAGVTTLQPVSGGGRVVWGITTTQSGYPEEEEISIVFIRDRVAKVLRAGFQSFIGNPETLETAAELNTRAVILLNSLVSQGLITAYADLAVARDEADPRQWNISVRVAPTYPVNFIYIKVALGQI